MSDEKPRIFQSGSDITLSLLAIIIVMALSVGFTGMCSFGDKSAEFVPVHKVDARTFLQLESRSMPFPVRLPDAPEGWVANSARRSVIGGYPAPVVGWVVEKTGYIQMTQTQIPADHLMEEYSSDVRDIQETYMLDDVPVIRYSSNERGVRDVRLIDLSDVRIVFEGAATDAEFDEIIRRTVHAAPLVHE